MKSFEKFQYDTSPYEIDEEVEELDAPAEAGRGGGAAEGALTLPDYSGNLGQYAGACQAASAALVAPGSPAGASSRRPSNPFRYARRPPGRRGYGAICSEEDASRY